MTSQRALLRILIVAVVFLSVSLSVSAAIIPVGGPIVPCGRAGQTGTDAMCNICHIPVLIKNLIDYSIFYIALPLAIIMFTVAGFFFLTSGGSTQKTSQARQAITTTVKGVALVLLAWLIVDNLILMLTGQKYWANAPTTAPWNQLSNPADCPLNPALPEPPVAPSNFGCDFDPEGNGICVLGGPGEFCSPSDPGACGGTLPPGGANGSCDDTFGPVSCISGTQGSMSYPCTVGQAGDELCQSYVSGPKPTFCDYSTGAGFCTDIISGGTPCSISDPCDSCPPVVCHNPLPKGCRYVGEGACSCGTIDCDPVMGAVGAICADSSSQGSPGICRTGSGCFLGEATLSPPFCDCAINSC